MQSIPLIDKILAWITRKTPRLNNIINKALEEAYDLGYRDGIMNNNNRLLFKGIKFDYSKAINNKKYLA